jgi:putative transposase
MLQEMLKGELDNELGYSRYDYKNKNTDNGHNKRTVLTELGDVDIKVPRNRNSDFNSIVIKKHQKNVTGIEDQILALYAKGVSTREIQDRLQHLHGIDVSPTLISNVTNKIMPMIEGVICWVGNYLRTNEDSRYCRRAMQIGPCSSVDT